jgi:hypothetical protein
MIDGHNLDYRSGKSSFWMELNKFSDLSDAEYRKMLGYKPLLDVEASNLKESNCTHLNIVPPSAVDWRTAGAVTQVQRCLLFPISLEFIDITSVVVIGQRPGAMRQVSPLRNSSLLL